MGYSTRYTLNIIGPSNTSPKDFEADIASIIDYNPFEEPCKWYDHEDDMKGFSSSFPDIVFELHGEGEESEDQWKKYFKYGKMQVCKAIITFPEFDAGKLQ